MRIDLTQYMGKFAICRADNFEESLDSLPFITVHPLKKGNQKQEMRWNEARSFSVLDINSCAQWAFVLKLNTVKLLDFKSFDVSKFTK